MSDTLILGTRKGLLFMERTNGKWNFIREAHTAIPVSYAMTDPRTGTLWACLDHGHWGQKLHRSRDMGTTWEEVPAPRYPEGTTIPTNMFEPDGETRPATVSYLWTVTPGGVDQPQRLYIGTEPGGLFQSDDGGDNFHLVETLWNHPTREGGWFGGGRDFPGLCSICVDPRDSRHITVGISVGGVYESHDDGQTWEPCNKGLKANYLPNPDAEVGHDPHFMVAAPSNPGVLWQQNHCGVFHTVDGARSWEDVSQADGPVYFGFAIAVDAEKADTAWVVPAVSDEFRVAVDRAMCVCRTDDGGKTWTAFRAGLPQDDCYDFVFRHALDLSGNRLAFGTTTGNVYVSDDRGESWDCISHYLPPVYSVRFVSDGV